MAGDMTVTKATLKTAEGEPIEVEAYFNPTQFVQNKTVAWKVHTNTEGDEPTLEFTAGEPMTMGVELMFDLMVERGDVQALCVSKVMRMASADKRLKRPPRVVLTLGGGRTDVFSGVITRVSATYSEFTPEGIATRARVDVTLLQATSVTTPGTRPRSRKSGRSRSKR
jgi:hypothetical protein